jgi:hypothetical protein
VRRRLVSQVSCFIFTLSPPQELDERTIELNYFLTKATKTNLTCRKNGQSNVGTTLVRVAEELEAVQNFACNTTNLTTVTCSFRQPKSFTTIKYKLKFSLDNKTKVSLQKYLNGMDSLSSANCKSHVAIDPSIIPIIFL